MKPIHILSKELGLTSRTLRFWEAEELFDSKRDEQSGWRVYDADTELTINLIKLLRQLDIPLKAIRNVSSTKEHEGVIELIENQLLLLKTVNQSTFAKIQVLNKMKLNLRGMNHKKIDKEALNQYETYLIAAFRTVDDNTREEYLMNKISYVTLPRMRGVYHIEIGDSPENEALIPVLQWLESANLLGTARLFGGNMPPMPSGEGKPYGYGMYASIPDGVDIPKHLKEMVLPGGVYAKMESSENISLSWRKMLKMIHADGKYVSDRTRLCLEEHIRNDNPTNGGMEYSITLLEPVK